MAIFKVQQSMALVILFAALTNLVSAQNINGSENKTTLCIECHGNNGNSNNPQYPSLAGQKAAYIASQLNAFKTGLRTDTVMQT